MLFVVMPVAVSMVFGQIFGRFGIVTPILHDIGLSTDCTSPFVHNRRRIQRPFINARR